MKNWRGCCNNTLENCACDSLKRINVKFSFFFVTFSRFNGGSENLISVAINFYFKAREINYTILITF